MTLFAGLSLGFSACSDDDDDDDEKTEQKDKDSESGEEDKQGEGKDGDDSNTTKNAIVGTWKANLSKYNEKFFIDGTDLGEGKEDEDDPTTVEDFIWGGTITFNEDGTCTSSNYPNSVGSYKISSDNEIEISFNVQGEDITLKKGDWSKKQFQEAMDEDEDKEYLKISETKNESYKATVNGDELTLKLVMSGVFDYSAIRKGLDPSDPFAQMELEILEAIYGEDLVGKNRTEITEVYTREK